MLRRALTEVRSCLVIGGAGVAVFAGSAVSGAVTTHDLAADWSVSSNPNGAWSYNRALDDPHPSVIADYFGNGTMQPAWAAAAHPQFGHISVFLKHIDGAVGDPAFIDRVMIHTNDPSNSPSGYANAPANVAWVCPSDGSVDIEGGLWLHAPWLGRTTVWSLTLNGVEFTSGAVHPHEAWDVLAPKPLSTGVGGSLALRNIVVAPGDVIRLVLTRSAGDIWGTSTGVDFTISLDTNPPCNPADVALPHGLLDLSDVNLFVEAFVAEAPPADLNDDGLYDLTDVNMFVSAFLSGCL